MPAITLTSIPFKVLPLLSKLYVTELQSLEGFSTVSDFGLRLIVPAKSGPTSI